MFRPAIWLAIAGLLSSTVYGDDAKATSSSTDTTTGTATTAAITVSDTPTAATSDTSSSSSGTAPTAPLSRITNNPTLQSPHVHLLAPDWTRVDSHGQTCDTYWGGWGGTHKDKTMMSWDLTLNGEDHWIEAFVYTTYKYSGEWLATELTSWDKEDAAKPEVDQTFKCWIWTDGSSEEDESVTLLTTAPWVSYPTTGIVTAAGCIPAAATSATEPTSSSETNSATATPAP